MAFTRHSKEEALETVKDLVKQFGENIRYYRSESYLEANCKSDFINKFLSALNWDVNNDNGVAPKYKEVVMEARSRSSAGVVKHPDYALCIGGNPVYYLEAKAPSVKILNDSVSALQIRQYAFSSKKPLSILTDFEEFAVYDTRKRPVQGETAENARIKYLTYDKYVENFDYIWDTFAYDSAVKGSVDTFFEKTDGNYSKNDVNEEMLDAIEEWREMMIKGIRVKDGKLTEDNLNMAVQRLVNRFVYIWRNVGY